MVTGADGQLGSELRELAAAYPQYHFLFTTKASLSITDNDLVTLFFEKQAISFCINCAAYTAVDKAETEKEKAFAVNAIAAGHLATACKAHKTQLIHISTDYVFDGSAHKAYIEEDTPCPQSVYGDSKLLGEQEVLKYDKSYILRTAWLFGPHGNNFVKTMLRLAAEKGEVGVVTDQIGNPTSTFELVRMIDAVLKKGEFGIYHATCNGVCSWNEFAREVFRVAGMDVKVNDLTTDQFPRPAKRPAYSDLSKDKLLKVCGYRATDWHDALKEYFDYLKAEEIKQIM